MNIMKRNRICTIIVTGLLVQVIHPCLNIIKNNTERTYKIAEIKQENLFLKKVIDLPDDYLKDEQKAHTVAPGESVSFGGHYLPTFAIFKEYTTNENGKESKAWESILVVKQTKCGPRGKEEKTLLLTDVLKGQLPGDFQPSYKFDFKKSPETIVEISSNQKMLTSNANRYQLVSQIFAKFEEQIQEILSLQLHEEKVMEAICPAGSAVLKQGKEEAAPAEHKHDEHKGHATAPAAAQPVPITAPATPAAAEPAKATPATEQPKAAPAAQPTTQQAVTPTPKVEQPNTAADEDGDTCGACGA